MIYSFKLKPGDSFSLQGEETHVVSKIGVGKKSVMLTTESGLLMTLCPTQKVLIVQSNNLLRMENRDILKLIQAGFTVFHARKMDPGFKLKFKSLKHPTDAAGGGISYNWRSHGSYTSKAALVREIRKLQEQPLAVVLDADRFT